MNRFALLPFAFFALLLSGSVLAAKPAKITPGSSGGEGAAEFRNYSVECSNGKSMSLTSWDNGKRWCVGENSQQACVKKQIKAAKAACKLA